MTTGDPNKEIQAAATDPDKANPLAGETLTDFLSKHQHQALLTALAVTATLMSLFANLQVHWVSYVLNIVCVATMLVIWWELHGKFPKKADWKLKAFKVLLLTIMLLLALYWLIAYKTFWQFSIMLVFPLFVTQIAVYILKTVFLIFQKIYLYVYKLLRKAPPKPLIISRTLAVIVTIIVYIYSLFAAVWLLAASIGVLEILSRLDQFVPGVSK